MKFVHLRRWRLRLPSVAVAVALAAVTVAGAALVKSDAKTQQRSLLEEKATIAALLAGSIFGGWGQGLAQLVQTNNPVTNPSGSFLVAAKPLLGEMSTVGLVEVSNGQAHLQSSVGAAPAEMRAGPVPPRLDALLVRAASAKSFVSDIINFGSERDLVFAQAASPNIVAYGIVAYNFEHPYVGGGEGNPFTDLQGAIYAGPRVEPQDLILADTTALPLTGAVVEQTTSVGADQWTIVAKAAGPLTSSLVGDAAWGVLIGGLLAAILAAAVVEVLVRRRRYAISLVEERTAALQLALDRQAQLESEERAARHTAEAANRSKSEFLSRMSHELRTPLNAILGFGQLLQLDELTESQEEAVTQITKGGRHLLALVNDVLDISRIETGNLGISAEAVSIGEVVGEALAMLTPAARDRQIDLTVPQERLGDQFALADHQRLKQVLLNLVSNAIKYNRVGGRVSVGVESSAVDRIRIYVDDDGPGIPPEKLDRLFMPFDRLGAEYTPTEGVGVGLALSRRLAEAMAGTLGVESRFGAGSRFWIDLPLAACPLDGVDGMVADAGPVGVVGSGGEGRHAVVYIEDNPSNIRLVELLLARRNDVDLLPATEGQSGIRLAVEHQPDLILIDMHLSDMDGLNILRQIRSTESIASTPVVVLSADASPRQISRMLSEGATAYLTKPLEATEFYEEVSRAISGAGRTAAAAAVSPAARL